MARISGSNGPFQAHMVSGLSVGRVSSTILTNQPSLKPNRRSWWQRASGPCMGTGSDASELDEPDWGFPIQALLLINWP